VGITAAFVAESYPTITGSNCCSTMGPRAAVAQWARAPR